MSLAQGTTASAVDAETIVTSGYADMLDRLRACLAVDEDWSTLVDDAVTMWSRPGFDTFVTVPTLPFSPYDYQVQAAQTALRRMRGRAILADEVGLGKTIEAGLVLAELRQRGLADKTLVIVPAGLVGQWQEELDRKFLLPSVVPRAGSWEQSTDRPVVVASLAAARRDPLRSTLTGECWDLIVVDEAHRVRNPRSASGRLARALRTRYLLMLTATPVENRLDDLFELVSLVAPGLLGTAKEFHSRHGGTAASDARAVRDVAALQARMREVMVRHRRSEVSVMLPQRLAETVRVVPTPDEAALYTQLGTRIREAASSASTSTLLALRHTARLAGSGPIALAPALTKLGWHELATDAAAVTSGKERPLLELLDRRASRGEKVVVFSAFRRTVEHLAAVIESAGLAPAVYHGGLSRRAKDQAVCDFSSHADVLVTTEAAGEGRNLQFCHVMINYDLPWNPMQIEQRLGRLHRIGQDHDVELTNLVTAGTIDDHLLRVLETKINLFELVVGELDMILGRISDELDLESAVFTSYVDAADDAEFAARLEALGDELAGARRDYLASREATDLLVAEPA
ncbi:MAG: DEAD/DEAH box helicase [Actinomycetota bacterium]|nr:DEAD/DEAH box helicase [Actinomycetota bacterium]